MADIHIKVENYARCALQTPRWWGGEVPLEGNRLLVGGGNIPSATDPKHETGTTEVELLDMVRCRSERLGKMLRSDHRGSQPQILSNGQAVFFGGITSDVIEVMSGKVVRSGGRLLVQRSAAASVELSDGRVLITGGYSNAGGKAVPVASAEIYNPKTKTNTVIASLQMPRASHSITPIGYGRYLLVGGAMNAAATAEIFDERTNSFSKLSEGPRGGRKDHRAVLDSARRIWFIGGTDQNRQSQDVLEYYDIGLGLFVSTSMELSEGREDAAALFIPELNLIVVAGGEKKGAGGQADSFSNAVEVIDLTTMQIKSTTLQSVRDEPTLHVLSVNPQARTAEILVLQGVAEGTNGQKRVPPPEKISIKINELNDR